MCGEVTDQSSVPWINREPELPRLTVVDRMFQTNTLTRYFKSWVTFKKKKKICKASTGQDWLGTQCGKQTRKAAFDLGAFAGWHKVAEGFEGFGGQTGSQRSKVESADS